MAMKQATTRRLLTVRRRIRPAPAASIAGRRIKNNSKWEDKFKVRVVRLKREMKEISKDQKLIGEQQRQIRGKLEEIRHKCARIRQESEVIFKQQASNQVLLDLMFKILRARNNGDFVGAANATTTLREVMAKVKSGEDTTGIGN